MVASGVSYLRARKLKLDVNSLIVIIATALLFGLFGAKLMYVFVTYDLSDLSYIIKNRLWSALIDGGQVFYGGLLGGVLGALLGAKIASVWSLLPQYIRAIVPSIPLAHAIGRVGCFFAGCCYGAPCNGPLCVRFPLSGVYQTVFPIQLVESFLNVIIFIILLVFDRKRKDPWRLLALYLLVYAVTRFVLEYFRGDAIRGFAAGLSTSQWISLALILVGIILFLPSKKEQKKEYP